MLCWQQGGGWEGQNNKEDRGRQGCGQALEGKE